MSGLSSIEMRTPPRLEPESLRPAAPLPDDSPITLCSRECKAFTGFSARCVAPPMPITIYLYSSQPSAGDADTTYTNRRVIAARAA